MANWIQITSILVLAVLSLASALTIVRLLSLLRREREVKDRLRTEVRELKQKNAEQKKEIERTRREGIEGTLRREEWGRTLKKRLRTKDQAICVFSLDSLREVNNTYGHAYGDIVISLLARTLRTSLKKRDLIGRLSGNEFIVAFELKNVADEELQLSLIFERVREHFVREAQKYFQKEFGTSNAPFDLSYSDTYVSRGQRDIQEVYDRVNLKLYSK